jgi:hypothetical protein
MTCGITIRLDEEDLELFRLFAMAKGISIAELVRKSVREKIDRELKAAKNEKQLALPGGESEPRLKKEEAKHLILKLLDEG